MFNLCALDETLDLLKFRECIRLRKAKMLLDPVPPSEEYKFLVFAIFINSPTTSIAVRGRILTEMRSTSLENTLKLGLSARFDEVPTYAQDWCVERDAMCRRLSQSTFTSVDASVSDRKHGPSIKQERRYIHQHPNETTTQYSSYP